MAVAAVKAGIQTSEDIARAAYERSVEVMKRQWTTYDHEKVFWNSVWTVGLVGLGYVAVKLGAWIMQLEGEVVGVENLIKDPAGVARKDSYTQLYAWCDPAGENYTRPISEFQASDSVATIIRLAIKVYRDNPSKWAKVKADYKAQYGTDQPAGRWYQPAALGNVADVLAALERFYNTYGPILPFAAVVGHMGLESLRVYRIRKKLK